MAVTKPSFIIGLSDQYVTARIPFTSPGAEPPLEVGVQFASRHAVQPMPATRNTASTPWVCERSGTGWPNRYKEVSHRLHPARKRSVLAQFSDISHAMRLGVSDATAITSSADGPRIDYYCPAERVPDQHHADMPAGF